MKDSDVNVHSESFKAYFLMRMREIIETTKTKKMNEWKCSYGKACECNSDVEKSECDLAYKTNQKKDE